MKTNRTPWQGLLALLGISALTLVGATGCQTEAFCFEGCGETSSSSSSSGDGGTGGSGAGSGEGGAGGCLFGCGSSSGGGNCEVTNGGVEACDNLDNDCDGQVDEAPDVNFDNPRNCGTCDNNCYLQLLNTDPAGIGCDWNQVPNTPGTCTCNGCASGYYDLNNDCICEYYCVKTANDDTLCNNKDDDCDNLKDEDIDVCTSTTDCGGCGNNCVVVHGTPECTTTAMPGQTCSPANTKCAIAVCENGWWDLDGAYSTGCEYPCDLTNNGIEICGDSLDNDCDGKIDEADDLSGDSRIGMDCSGDPDGVCGDMAHFGKYACIANKVVCAGMDVLIENQQQEVCNGLDDDCDGTVDDNPTNVGQQCGMSNVFPCSFGVTQCQNGMPVCVGAVEPQMETCNGVDDNCDGMIDQAGGMPPMDSVGMCNVPAPPPMGATSPCRAGNKACIGGTIVCQGSVGPTSTTDACGVDANCDGVLTNQPDVMVDVHNCGMCGNDCLANGVHANFSCNMGMCMFTGCEPGYYDIDGNNTCEYACNFIQAQEICDNQDQNCNGEIDENVVIPTPAQICGTSPASTSPECTTQVMVACVNGAFQCTFPMGVCPGGCSADDEICDTLDNDCDGALNENVPNYGRVCASDDGLPAPGDGACRTVGNYVCNGPTMLKCSAVKADCATLPGGCTEKCDNIDNDCDGKVDEVFTNKGMNPMYYIGQPAVKLGNSAAGPWIFAYEASRPSATTTSAGAGNGFFNATPIGITADQTISCSTANVLPWYDLTPREVEQSCSAVGGRICRTSEWKQACRVNNADGAGPNTPDTDNNCSWGYNPLGSCKTQATYNGAYYCNLGGFDFDTMTAGNQDGLLPTNSTRIANCRAPWNNYNGVTTQAAFDITGNLREVTRCQLDRAVCGPDATLCAKTCCSGTSTAATLGVRLCGTLTAQVNNRLSGQACAANSDCCNTDLVCNGNGVCNNDSAGVKYCQNTGGVVPSCHTRGVACTTSAQCCNGEACAGGFCGGPSAIPHATYPLLGGAYTTTNDDGGACGFDFYKVDENFKFYDTGFRCCFDADPQ